MTIAPPDDDRRQSGGGASAPPRHAAALDHHAAHAIALDQVHVVRRDQHRDADFVEALEDVHDLDREVRVEVAGRLVGDQQRRLADDRARDADALLLAGRQLDRTVLLAAEQAHLVERGAHALADLLLRHARRSRAAGPRCRRPGGPSAACGPGTRCRSRGGTAGSSARQRRGVLAVHHQRAARRALDQRDELEQRALAGARVAR